MNEEQAKQIQEEKPTNTGIVEEKTFTQNEVNDIVRGRLEKLYSNYGVNNSQELDELVNKAKSYDEMLGKYGDLENTNQSLTQRLSFVNNNINPDREDDILAYFKGKELSFNDETLKGLLETHPEWVNKPTQDKTTLQVMGNQAVIEKPKVNEEDEVAKMFGLSRFIKM